ncbi:MAG: hypothetical protein LLG01_00635 [Planctomycetaceae bacterium]|nr:hypothetical protein [Planctomycetaceae bacterium]
MSQRLYVGRPPDDGYDCILTGTEGAREKLRSEWLCMFEGFYAGPFKIRIGDLTLFAELKQVIADVLESVGRVFPDDVWVFYCGDSCIEHPTEHELSTWLDRIGLGGVKE